MSLLLSDKFRPQTELDLTYNRNIWGTLKSIANQKDVPHILFYGPEGAGVKLLMNMFLLELFKDEAIKKMTTTTYTVNSSGNNTKSKIEVPQSKYHIVIHLDKNNFDKYIIQNVIKAYSQQMPLQLAQSARGFRAVVIDEIDHISKHAQAGLRRTMEDYKQCRFVLWCHNNNPVIKALRSRCFCIRIPAPSEDEVMQTLISTSILAGLRIPLKDWSKFEAAGRDLRKGFRMLEAYRWGVDPATSYDAKMANIVKKILKRDPSDLGRIREGLYEMMVTNITCTQIMIDLTNAMMKHSSLTDDDKIKIAIHAGAYEHRLVLGRRDIKHLTAFVIHVMRDIKPIVKDMPLKNESKGKKKSTKA
jgi:replication factor C subunit 3/5